MRDVRKYEVFQLADQLVLEVYRVTAKFPKSEMFGMIGQMRRAAASIPMNLAEGAARAGAKNPKKGRSMRRLNSVVGISVLFLVSLSRAQQSWTRTYGGSADDHGFSVQQTTDGGYIVGGYTSSYGAGYADAYLVRTNAAGDTLWMRTYGGGVQRCGPRRPADF